MGVSWHPLFQQIIFSGDMERSRSKSFKEMNGEIGIVGISLYTKKDSSLAWPVGRHG